MKNAKEAIKQGLKSLLQTKRYEKITVADICEKADVSRRTFYKHFDNIEEIVATQIYDDFVAPVYNLRSLLPVDEIKSSTLLMLEMSHHTAHEQRDYYARLLHYKGHNSLVETMVEKLYALNQELYENSIESSDEREFVAYLFAWLPSIVLLWLLDEQSEMNPKLTAKYIDRWAFAHWREINQEKFS